MESIINVSTNESDQDGQSKMLCSHQVEERGQKNDGGKQSWYFMPLSVLTLLADVFEAGVTQKGYSPFNCLKPFENGDRRFWDATMRHLTECQRDPLAIDEETGCWHGAQAAWNILMRTYHAVKAKGGDH